MNPGRSLFEVDTIILLSPHIDDVIYSMGGLLPKLVRSSRSLTLINVMSATCYTAYGPTPEAYAIRKREEALALTILGLSEMSVMDLGFPDLSVPQPDQGATSTLQPRLNTVIRECLAEAQATHPVICVPAGVGRHPDHLAVLGCASQLEIIKVYFQEFPYLLSEPLVGRLFEIYSVDIELHLDAIECFMSQVAPGTYNREAARDRYQALGGIAMGV